MGVHNAKAGEADRGVVGSGDAAGWVTMGEAEALGPENCVNKNWSFPAEGACLTGSALIQFCSDKLTEHFGVPCAATSASSCSVDNGYDCRGPSGP
jgi:hypothetical protein